MLEETQPRAPSPTHPRANLGHANSALYTATSLVSCGVFSIAPDCGGDSAPGRGDKQAGGDGQSTDLQVSAQLQYRNTGSGGNADTFS
jgi:hypothetical protein